MATFRLFTGVAAMFLVASVVQADVISVNFNGANLPGGNIEYPMGNNSTLVGVVPMPASNFHNITGATGAGIALNSNVAANAATLTFTANWAYHSDSTGTVGSENHNFMYGYLDMTGSTNFLTVSNLSSVFSGGYDLYIYTDTDDAAPLVTKNYIISGADSGNGTYTRQMQGGYTYGDNPPSGYDETTGVGDPGNWFKVALTGTTFTLMSNSGNGIPISGFQIVSHAVPEPATGIMLLSGLGLVVAARRRRS